MILEQIVPDYEIFEFLAAVKHNCGNFVNHSPLPLYRGTSYNKPYVIKKIRQNRRLKDTHRYPRGLEMYDSIMQLKTGIKDFREKVTYVTSDYDTGEVYANGKPPMIVFPENGCGYAYAEDAFGNGGHRDTLRFIIRLEGELNALVAKGVEYDNAFEQVVSAYASYLKVSRSFSELGTVMRKGSEVSLFGRNSQIYMINPDVLLHAMRKKGMEVPPGSVKGMESKLMGMVKELMRYV